MVLKNFLYGFFISNLPKKWLSYFLGQLTHIQIPQKLNQVILKAFVAYYQIDMEEVEKPLEDYSCLGDFFVRKLKKKNRPIQGSIIHPCDGQLIQSGSVYNKTLIQAKNKNFHMDSFVPENPWKESLLGSSFFTYYLAPKNYHRVHSPITGKILWSTLIPGQLWPVNTWSVRNKEGLYCINERVAVGIESSQGKAIVVLVGATNVGSMSFNFDPQLQTNHPSQGKEPQHQCYTPPHFIRVGEELGCFHLGSTVVVLFSKKWNLSGIQRQEVQMGQPLVSRAQ